MPKEQKETPLKQVPYEGLNGSRKSVGEEKVEEEVGVSSSAAMKAAQAEAKLRKKEQDAVKKEKKALKREEASPAVEKVIESIKINKCTPKSPNVVIMPKKDDITDKAGGKTTKDVVSKKHKQFFNKEDKVKTFRQFVTETEQVDEGLGAILKGTAQFGKQAIQKSGKQVLDVAKGAGNLGKDVVKHGGDALQQGAKTIQNTGDIGKGMNKTGIAFAKDRIKASGVKYKPGMAKKSLLATKGKIKSALKTGKDSLEVASNVKHLTQTVDGDSHTQSSGSHSGSLKNPT